MQEDEEKEGLFSDNNTEPDGKWVKLKLGDKLKGKYILYFTVFFCQGVAKLEIPFGVD